MPFHVNFLFYKAFTKKKTLHAAFQGETARLPSLPPKGRHELPCEITPKASPLGASGGQNDGQPPVASRVRTREKGAKSGRRKITPPERYCPFLQFFLSANIAFVRRAYLCSKNEDGSERKPSKVLHY